MAKRIDLAGSVPVNDGERTVVQALVAGLPDDYVVVPNVELADGRGQRLEFDVVVAAPHAVYVVETKALHGRVVGDDREWIVDGSTRPAPIRITAHKARVLKSFLANERPVLRQCWTEPAVVLAVPPRQLDLLGDAKATTFDPKGLVAFIGDPGRLPHPPRHIDRLPAQVAELMQSRARGRGGPTAFNQWEVVETLEADDEITEYRARHRFVLSAPLVRLRVVSLSPYAFSPAELERRRQSIAREFVALQVMGAHENVVGAQDMFEDAHGNVVLVVPEVQGLSLGIALAEGLDLDDAERRAMLVGLCRAVRHAHEHGVIHRRIAPENVLLTEGGGVALSGFGSARVASEGTIYQTSANMDSLGGYGAPELLDPTAGEVSAATDLFGLAGVAWALFVETPPYPEGTPIGSVPARPDALPAAIYDVVAPWLERRVSDRDGAVADLEAVLTPEATGHEEVATPAALGPTAPLEFTVGEVIENRYEVTAVLGRGGFSTVYRVEDAVLEMTAALKLFSPQYDLEAMQRELRALSRIHHPNVVRLIDAGRTSMSPRQWYLKSEYVDGRTLSDVLDEEKRLPIELSVRLVMDLLGALTSFHPDQARIAALKAKDEMSAEEFEELQRLETAGLVHRDIKPQNLLLTADNQIKLIDFNIASQVGAPVRTVAGTPGYQPPEADLTQWDVTPDLFAVGVVLFELITGTHPYEGRIPGGVGPADACQLIEGLSPELGEFLAKACASEREERFSTAVEMLDALRSVASVDSDSEDRSPRPPTPPAPPSASSFRGTTLPIGNPPSGHRQVGWVTTADFRFPLVLAADTTDPDVVGVLSGVTTSGDTRYPAVRGAYLWLPGGGALDFEKAVTASWVVGDAEAGDEALSEQLGPTEWRFAWSEIDVAGLGVVELEVLLVDKDGSAFLTASARPSAEAEPPAPVTPPLPTHSPTPAPVSPPPEAMNSPALGELHRFIVSRLGDDRAALPLMDAFLELALARGDLEAEIGASSRTDDGYGSYLMLRWRGPQRFGAAAYLWPKSATIDWRLPTTAAANRTYVQPRKGKNQSNYQVKSTLVDEASLAEALELLDEAVAVVSGDASQPLGTRSLEGPSAQAVEPSPERPVSEPVYGYAAADWERLIDAGEAYLVTRAQGRLDTDYTEFCREVRGATGLELQPHDHALRFLLGEIGTRTYDDRGVVITVLIHYKDGSDAGDGFFGLCQQLGLLPKGKLDAESKLIFQAQHTTEVFDAYRRRRRTEPAPAPNKPSEAGPRDNRAVYAEIQRLEKGGDIEAARALAIERGWAEVAAAIDRRATAKADERGSPGGTYVALTVFLRENRASRVKLAFDELEEILGRPLPASARTHRPWWANTEGNSQARAWLSAGWKVHRADLALEEVEFARR